MAPNAQAADQTGKKNETKSAKKSATKKAAGKEEEAKKTKGNKKTQWTGAVPNLQVVQRDRVLEFVSIFDSPWTADAGLASSRLTDGACQHCSSLGLSKTWITKLSNLIKSDSKYKTQKFIKILKSILRGHLKTINQVKI